MIIRKFKDSDYPELVKWWNDQGESAPKKSLLPETTFILEVAGRPLLSLCLYLTNVKGLAYFENFVGNPLYEEERKQYAPILVEHCISLLKDIGYENVVCLTDKKGLKNKYENLGMKKTNENLTSFVREIK